jgi:quercetin dioxygenase-like cupin family protein
MPVIVNEEDTVITRQDKGWAEVTLVDTKGIGAPPMVARRWILKPGTKGPELVQGKTDQLLYVIKGSGSAIVDGVEMRLSNESVLWLEHGERFQFVTTEDELEILQGYAPGD